jgi:4-hydroxybenzoate polyprenyltransferase
MNHRLRSLAATLRLPNLPSVLSNTLSGMLFASALYEPGDLSYLPHALIAACCLYFSGNLFNDWADRSWDSIHRPERALPSGLFKPGRYLIGGVILTLTAWAVSAMASPAALLISIAITSFVILYTLLHKHSAWSVIPMALCRALLPVLGICATTIHWHRVEWLYVPSGMLFAYLIMLSLRARSESKASNGSKLTAITIIGFLIPPALLATQWCQSDFWMMGLGLSLIAAIPYLIWTGLSITRFRFPISRQVSALLAGIPLIDAMFLLPFVMLGHVFVNSPQCPVLSWLWLPAFIAGRLLQRLVPAT